MTYGWGHWRPEHNPTPQALCPRDDARAGFAELPMRRMQA